MRRTRLGMMVALGVSSFALLYACVGSDPDPASPAPDASTSSGGSSGNGSTSSSGASTTSSSGGSSGVDAGPLKCKSTEELCADACVDPASYTTSKDNCGACGHSCGGGECMNAACGPTVVVSNIQEQDGFDVMDGFVYFATNDNASTRASVHRCQVTGCAPEKVLFSTGVLGSSAHNLFATGGVFAFSLEGLSSGTIKTCPATECLNGDPGTNTDRRVYGTSGSRFFIAGGINTTSVHMLDCHPTKDDAGCVQTKLANESASVDTGSKGATDGTYLTYRRAHDGGGVELALCDLKSGCDGGTTVDEQAPAHNVMTAGKLFLMRAGSNPDQPNGGIKQCDLPCTTSTPTDFAKAIQNPTDLAADEDAVYWMSPSPGYDAILTCPASGCGAVNGTQIASSLGANPKELRVNGGFIYWTSDTTAADAAPAARDIHRIAKPLLLSK